MPTAAAPTSSPRHPRRPALLVLLLLAAVPAARGARRVLRASGPSRRKLQYAYTGTAAGGGATVAADGDAGGSFLEVPPHAPPLIPAHDPYAAEPGLPLPPPVPPKGFASKGIKGKGKGGGSKLSKHTKGSKTKSKSGSSSSSSINFDCMENFKWYNQGAFFKFDPCTFPPETKAPTRHPMKRPTRAPTMMMKTPAPTMKNKKTPSPTVSVVTAEPTTTPAPSTAEPSGETTSAPTTTTLGPTEEPTSLTGEPTVSPAPSALIATTSPAPTVSAAPSTATKEPSAGTTGAPTTTARPTAPVTPGPTSGPTVSAVPTSSPVPTPTSDTGAPTAAPSPSPTLRPTVSAAPSTSPQPSQTPSTSPQPSASSKPSSAPTTVDATSFIVSFTLESQDLPSLADSDEAALTTESYLANYLDQVYSASQPIQVTDVTATQTGTSSQGGLTQIGLDLAVSMAGAVSGSGYPTQADIDSVIQEALSEPAVQDFIKLLNALPVDNQFSTTTSVAYSTATAPADEKGSSSGVFVASFLVAFGVLTGAAASFASYRRKRQGKMLRDFGEPGTVGKHRLDLVSEWAREDESHKTTSTVDSSTIPRTFVGVPASSLESTTNHFSDDDDDASMILSSILDAPDEPDIWRERTTEAEEAPTWLFTISQSVDSPEQQDSSATH